MYLCGWPDEPEAWRRVRRRLTAKSGKKTRLVFGYVTLTRRRVEGKRVGMYRERGLR